MSELIPSFNEFTPAGTNLDRGDFQFSGAFGQPSEYGDDSKI